MIIKCDEEGVDYDRSAQAPNMHQLKKYEYPVECDKEGVDYDTQARCARPKQLPNKKLVNVTKDVSIMILRL